MRPNDLTTFSKPNRSQANHLSDSFKETNIMQELKDPTFKTENLNVFQLSIQPYEGGLINDYYFAFANHGDYHPCVKAITTVCPSCYSNGAREILMQTQLCSHQGSIEDGVELWKGIENYLGHELETMEPVHADHWRVEEAGDQEYQPADGSEHPQRTRDRTRARSNIRLVDRVSEPTWCDAVGMRLLFGEVDDSTRHT